MLWQSQRQQAPARMLCPHARNKIRRARMPSWLHLRKDRDDLSHCVCCAFVILVDRAPIYLIVWTLHQRTTPAKKFRTTKTYRTRTVNQLAMFANLTRV